MLIQVCVILRIVLNENELSNVQGIEVIPCRATRNLPKEENFSVKIDSKDAAVTTVSWDGSLQVGALESRSIPVSHAQPVSLNNETSHGRFSYWSPQSLTRIAKTISLGLQPLFSKESFEPFERRQKPVTLIGIRKNGLFHRQSINVLAKSSEVAELQSPYNKISSFWVEDKNAN